MRIGNRRLRVSLTKTFLKSTHVGEALKLR